MSRSVLELLAVSATLSLLAGPLGCQSAEERDASGSGEVDVYPDAHPDRFDDSAPDAHVPLPGVPELPEVPQARSERHRETTTPNPENTRAVVAAQTAFALELLRQTPATESALLAPFSVHVALSMALAGADAQTRTEMAAVLGVTGEEVDFHQSQNYLESVVSRTGMGGEPTFRAANAAFGDRTLAIRAPFLDTIGQSYGAGVYQLDFVSEHEAARGTINDWIASKTEGHIPELLLPGQVTPTTRLVLANAVYFLGDWATPFEKESTRERPFRAAGGDVAADFMHQSATHLIAASDAYTAIELPYSGEAYSLLAIMPKGELADFERTVDAPALDAVVAALTYTNVDLAMPRFEVRSRALLGPALKAMGMPSAFDTTADFQRMTAEKVAISDVVTEAWMRVDEKGTEAAAATAIVFDGGAAPPPDGEVKAITLDRPFLYAIRHRETGVVLFLGRFLGP